MRKELLVRFSSCFARTATKGARLNAKRWHDGGRSGRRLIFAPAWHRSGSALQDNSTINEALIGLLPTCFQSRKVGSSTLGKTQLSI